MNKYQEALNALCDEDEMYKLAKGFSFDDDYTSEYDYEKAKEYCKNKIQELVNNLPLKFEYLHEGMWIWDDKNKIYNLIYEKRINCAKEKEIEFQWEMPDRECQNFMTDVYEENRFYRREVQQ